MPSAPEQLVQQFGRRIIAFLIELARVAALMRRVISEMGGLFRDRGLFIQECVTLGTESLPLVLLVGIFTGAVTGWQAHYQLEGYMPFDLIGPGVWKSLMLELGPALTGLVIAGRVSAGVPGGSQPRPRTGSRLVRGAGLPRGPVVYALARQAPASFSRLWARQTDRHSCRAFSNPRKRNCRNPRAPLICLKTGSTVCWRRR